MTPEIVWLLGSAAALIAVAAIGLYLWLQRTPAAIASKSDEPLPLFGVVRVPGSAPTVPARTPVAPMAAVSVSAVAQSAPTPAVTAPQAAPQAAPPGTPPGTPPGQLNSHRIVEFNTVSSQPAAPKQPVSSVPTAPSALTASPATTASTAPAVPVVNDAGIPGTLMEGHALRYSIPAEGTLQFLPGRLEIEQGLDAGREIRFVQLPGPTGLEVTFGRSEGEPYRHVQLRDLTVSRQHAKMRFHDGNWSLTNLSQTNPVFCNGSELDGDAELLLADGDRIEMGEVVFTFRER